MFVLLMTENNEVQIPHDFYWQGAQTLMNCHNNKSYTLLCITALPTPPTVRFKYRV
jgi:hypothetical protein